MSAGVAENPAAAVHVQDGGQRADRVDRFEDADPHVADLRRNGDPLVGHFELGDRRSLDVVEDLASTVGAEFVEERGLRGGVREFLGRAFEEVLAHKGFRPFLITGSPSRPAR